MKAQDLMDNNNNRADAIAKITALCDMYGYSYKYTEKRFTITLPEVEEMPIRPTTTARRKLIKELNLDIFGPDTGIHEEDLPIVDTTLEEGETPEETK